jgi:hypothetical protein
MIVLFFQIVLAKLMDRRSIADEAVVIREECGLRDYRVDLVVKIVRASRADWINCCVVGFVDRRRYGGSELLVKVNIRMAPGLEGEKDKRWGRKHNDNTTALKVHTLAEEKKPEGGLGPPTYLWHSIAQLAGVGLGAWTLRPPRSKSRYSRRRLIACASHGSPCSQGGSRVQRWRAVYRIALSA